MLQLVQTRVDEPLAFLGRMILGVLAQVAVQAGLEDLPGQFIAQLVLQQGDLVLQLLFYFVRSHRTIIGQSPGGATGAAPRLYWATIVTVWVRPPAAIVNTLLAADVGPIRRFTVHTPG